jgi:hypothetical protein
MAALPFAPMTTRRRRLPDAPLRTSVFAAAGLGLLGAVLLGLAVGPLLRPSARYPFVVAVVFALMAALVIGTIAEGHPFPRFGPANHVTMLRAVLVAGDGLLVEVPARGRLVRGDGGMLVARRRGRLAGSPLADASAFGARFDMEVDAFFILRCLLVWRFGQRRRVGAGLRLMRYALSRPDGCAVDGSHDADVPGKLVAVLQLVGLATALAPIVPSPLSDMVAAVTLAALTWSFAVDVRRLSRATQRP